MKTLWMSALVWACVAASALGVRAAEQRAALGLQQAIDIALENNFTLLSAKEAINGAEHQRESAFTDFFPKARGDANFTHIGDVATVTSGGTPRISILSNGNVAPSGEEIGFIPARTGTTVPAQVQDSWILRGTVTQSIFTGGALLNRYRFFKIGVESAQTSWERLRQDVSLQVVQAYFNVLNAIEIKQVADQSVKLLENQRDVSQAFFDVGMIPKNDLLRTEVQLAQRVRDQTIATNTIEADKAQFNQVLQRPVQTPVELENILSYEPATFDLENAIRQALDRRLEIREAALRVAADERQVGVVSGGLYPQVQASVTGFQSEGQAGAAGGGATTGLKDGWSAIVSGTWAFWEWGKTREDIAAARSQVKRDQYALAQLKDQISVEVKNAYLAVITAERNLFTTRKAVEQAEEAFRMNQERYREQVGTITEVLDSETQLAQAQSDYYTALSNYNVSKAALYRAMGLKVYEPPQSATSGQGR
jgi:outer membrane protein